MPSNKTVDTFKIVLVYCAALYAALHTLKNYSTNSALVNLLQADIAATVIVYAGSVILKNASTYDAYWSIAPIAFIPFWIAESDGISIRAIITGILITVWGVRLTNNWYRGWQNLKHEDWRYVNLRNKTKFFFPFVNLMGIHLFPTILVFVGALSFQPALTSTNPLNPLDIVGLLVAIVGIYFEWRADKELLDFRNTKNRKPSDLLTTGIWNWCRHPNYFGESTFWFGMFILGLAAGGEIWPLILGPLAMLILFLGISIPMIDKRMLNKRPQYKNRMKEVAAFFPIHISFGTKK